MAESPELGIMIFFRYGLGMITPVHGCRVMLIALVAFPLRSTLSQDRSRTYVSTRDLTS